MIAFLKKAALFGPLIFLWSCNSTGTAAVANIVVNSGILDAPVKAIGSAIQSVGSSTSDSSSDNSDKRYATSAKNSSSMANIDDEVICRNAVQDDKPEWETGPYLQEDVKEAISRNLSPQKCFSLTGGESRLAARRAEEERQRIAAARRAEEERQRIAAARRAEEERKRQEEQEELKLQQPVLTSGGSGFSISQDGYVLTNQHVVEGCQIVSVHPRSGMKKASILATDDTNDLALLKISIANSEYMNLSSANASLLEDIIVAGYPLSLSGSLSDTVKVTKGVVSSLAGFNNDYSIMQIDAAVQPGNSGGPVLDEKGNVVGVTVAQLSKRKMLQDAGIIPENTNFAIKSSVAKTFAEANGVTSKNTSNKDISRTDLTDLIINATHFIGCWATGEQAKKAILGNNLKLKATPSMVKQVAGFK